MYKLKRRFSKDKGIQFENLCTQVLKKTFKKQKAKVLSDLLLINNGKSTQIDNLVITKNKIFVIEVKKRYGTILELEKGKKVQVVNSSTKHEFHDPVVQNDSHIRFLSSIVKNVELVNVVIYSDDAILNFKDNASINLRNVNYLTNRKDKGYNKEAFKIIKEHNKNTIFSRFKHKRYVRRKQKNG